MPRIYLVLKLGLAILIFLTDTTYYTVYKQSTNSKLTKKECQKKTDKQEIRRL